MESGWNVCFCSSIPTFCSLKKNAFRSLYSSNDNDDKILILVNIKITQCLVYLCCIIYTKQYYFYDIEMYIYVYLQVSPLCFLSM